MDNNLKQLIELQKIDSRLLDIEKLRGDLPNTVEVVNQKLKLVQDEEEKYKYRIEEISSETRKHTADIDDNNIKLKKLNEQLFLVKSNKEYDALNFEIDHLKKTINDSEDTIIDLEEEKESINEKSKSITVDINDNQKILDETNNELKATMSKTQKEETQLKESRLKVASNISYRFLSNYDRLRQSRDGLGIMSIHSNACGACYTQLPRQTIIEVKQNSDVISCPSCSIYLFFDEESE